MLAREGMGVCVAEQAALPGGCLQSFSRRGHAIDTGMHYIGSMQAGGIMRRYFEYFGILGSLRLRPLDEAFDVVSLPGAGDYAYMHGYEAFEKHLGELFPHEKAGLGRYCAKLREIGGSIGIAGTNPLYGGVRESSTLYHHAMVNHSNIEGACRFTGGTQQIADALAAKIREHGGTMLVRSRVVALHTEGRRVTGVELADGRMLRAKTVISAIHPAETFRLIGPTPVIRKAFRERIGSLPDSYGLFSAYLLLKPGRIPYLNRNLYYFAGKDVWKTLFDLEAMRPGMVLLSAQAPDGNPAWCDVVTLMTPVATRPWEAWEGSAPGRRPEAYTALKAAMTQATVDFACARLPELRDAIAHTYAATPLTYRHYTGAPHGAAYGLLKDWRNIMASHIPARTKFENLLLTGQNLTVHGAIGVTLSAAATCSEIVGTEYLAKKIANA